MTFEVSSIRPVENGYIKTEVDLVECIDMYAVLTTGGMWLVLEGFENGYAFTESGVDRLHIILHDTIQPESAVTQLHDWLHAELPVLIN